MRRIRDRLARALGGVLRAMTIALGVVVRAVDRRDAVMLVGLLLIGVGLAQLSLAAALVAPGLVLTLLVATHEVAEAVALTRRRGDA